MIHKQKKAISLAELLIAIGIVGILAALTVPSVVKTLPNENELRYRQVYGRMLSAVSGLAFNNVEKFPTFIKCSSSNTSNADSACYNKQVGDTVYSGFRLLDNDAKPKETSSTGVFFCNEIARMFNTNGVINCSYSDDAMQQNFVTQNGMIFFGLQQGFGTSASGEKKQITICVDTNGEEGPNVGCTSDFNNPEKDRFRLQIGYRGDVAVGYKEPDPTNGIVGMYDNDDELSHDFYCIEGVDDDNVCLPENIDDKCNMQNGTWGDTAGADNFCIERSFLQQNYSPTKYLGPTNKNI